MRHAIVRLTTIFALAVMIAASLGAATLTNASLAAADSSCTTSWAGAASGDWTSSSMWTNGVPDSSSYACLPTLDQPYEVTISADTVQVAGLYVGQRNALLMRSDTPQSLSAADTIVNDGVVYYDGPPYESGSISTGSTPLLNHGTLDVLAGAVTISQVDMEDVVGSPTPATLTVVQGASASVSGLANLSGTTLQGGDYSIGGTLSVLGADVRTLSHATVELFGQFVNERGMVFGHLSSIGAGSSLFLGPNLGDFAIGDDAMNAGNVAVSTGTTLKTHTSYTQVSPGTTELHGGTIAPLSKLVSVQSGGTLTGLGTIAGSLVNQGAAGPNADLTVGGIGQLHVTGDYTATSTSTTAVMVNCYGTSQMLVDGIATFGGTLKINSSKCPASAPVDLPVVTHNGPGKFTGAFSTLQGAGYTISYSKVAATLHTFELADDTPGPITFDLTSRVTYGGWQATTDWTAPQGLYAASSTPGDTVTETLHGPSVAWTAHIGPDQGRARVTLDGIDRGAVDNYAPTSGFKVRSYNGLSAGEHVLTIRVLGTQRAVATGHAVGYSPAASFSGLAFSGWTPNAQDGASAQTLHTNPGRPRTTVSFTFTGEGISWVNRTGPSAGRARVVIDGVARGTVDLYSPIVNEQHQNIFKDLPAGNHSIVIQPTAAKNTLSTGTEVNVDAFVVLP